MSSHKSVRRLIWAVPPGASVRVTTASGEAALSIPLWSDWAFISQKVAASASSFEASDEVIDDMAPCSPGWSDAM